jgi:hypothetical protein
MGLLFFLAVISVVYFFVVEGFQSNTNAGDKARAACAANTTCSTCLGTPGCGWASDYASPVAGLAGVTDGTVVACIPQSGGNPFITPNLALLMVKLNGARTTLNKFITSLGDCTDITCTEKTTCKTCATFKKCTWQQVTAADTTITQSCMDSTAAGSGDTTHNNIKDVAKCPAPQCSDLTDCQDCTNATGCGFCSSSGKCLKTSEFGPGANQCPKDKQISLPAMCPCGAITDCAKCSGRVGCGFCKGIKQCVNVDRYGMPPANSCSADDMAMSESQCSAGTISQLSPAVDTRSSDGPTAAELYAAQNSGNLDQATSPTGGAGDKPVSPAPSYTHVTAPGVARAIGSSSVPASAANPTGLGDSPLESYVKMLVNSQLAAQGVPTNEPFQVNEAAAIPNASDYMKKVFRGVFN